jgi:hypothetical protein
MSNHIHGIVIINDMDIHCRGEVTSPLLKVTLENIVAYFKYQSAKSSFDTKNPQNIPLVVDASVGKKNQLSIAPS